MSAQFMPKKLRQQTILNMVKPPEKNVGPEPAGCILSDQLKTEIKSFVAKEFCAMKEEYQLLFDEIHEKLKDKESEIQKLKSKDEDQSRNIGTALMNILKRLELQEEKSVDGPSLSPEEVQQLREVITMKHTKLGVDGAALAQEEVQQLKGVIRRTKREEQSYWNRSIRISNLDQIPKEGSRYSNIKNILRKKGLEFLIIQCESYFLYNDKAASSSLRITFRSYQERNYYMIRARKQLRDLENKSIWLDNMVSPEFVAKKKELIHLGQTLKTEGEIVKFSVEMRQGFPQLKVITKESKVSWVDETSCDPNLSVRSGGM